MAEETAAEIKSKAFLAKCRGAALIIGALSALILGVLNWFREARDPRVKVTYEELSKQVVGLSGDMQKLAATLRTQAEEISTIQNWIISEQSKPKPPPVRPGRVGSPTGAGGGVAAAKPGPDVAKMIKSMKAAKPAPAPPHRAPPSWDKVQQQVQAPIKGD